MEHHDRELGREIKQRKRAESNGALVRPPRDERELRLEELANEAEIDMLEARRSKLYSALGQPLFESDRQRLAFDLESASRSLDSAYAAKRRLQVARELHGQGIFA